MPDEFVRASGQTEFRTRERVYITERLNDAAVPGVSLADASVEPGVTTELHRLTVQEYYVISLGSGLMEVGDGAPFQVGPGDSVIIPPGVPQRITNNGGTDLVFQCICMPRFTPDAYESLESG